MFWQDVRQAARSLGRAPGFTFWVVLLLTLTLGANAILFAVVEAVVLRPLPFDHPERLVWVWSRRIDRERAFFSIPDYRDFCEQGRTLENFAVFTAWGFNLAGPGGPERLLGVRTTANTFEVLGVRPQLGRVLQSSDGQPGSARAVVLTYGLWQRRFGGSSDVVGSTVTLTGQTFTVVGVLPRNFLFPGAVDIDIVVPLVLETDQFGNDRGTDFLRGFARLKPGVTLQQANDNFATSNARLKELYPVIDAKKTPPRVFPLQQEILGDFRPALLTLLAAVGLVLLLAATNLASLLLVRAMGREKEFAMRMALGASPRQLVRMQLTEAFLLAGMGGLGALALARLGLQGLLRLSPGTLPRAGEISFGAGPVVFTLAVALLTGALMGCGAALRASRALFRGGLGAEGRSATAHRSRRWGLESLVLVEVAIATLLLAATGLFLKSYAQLQSVSPGFTAENLVVVRGSLPAARYKDPAALQAVTRALLEKFTAIPGVESVASVSTLPMSALNNRMDFQIAGRPPATAEDVLTAQNRQASPGYFKTMQIPVLEGREFADADAADTQRVVIVDAALAREYFPGRSAVGEHLIIEKQDNLVVGVVGEVKHFGLDDPPFTTFYQPIAQIGAVQASFLVTRLNFVLRTQVAPVGLAQPAREALRQVDPEVPIANLRPMQQYLETWVAPRRFNLQLLGAFAALAMVLTGLGTYAVLATAARQRTQEIGIRLALGATRPNILQMVLRRALAICGLGVLLGMGAALLLAQPIRSQLYNVAPFDPAVLLSVAALVLFAGLAASFRPAWRASRVDPLASMRGM